MVVHFRRGFEIFFTTTTQTSYLVFSPAPYNVVHIFAVTCVLSRTLATFVLQRVKAITQYVHNICVVCSSHVFNLILRLQVLLDFSLGLSVHTPFISPSLCWAGLCYISCTVPDASSLLQKYTLQYICGLGAEQVSFGNAHPDLSKQAPAK